MSCCAPAEVSRSCFSLTSRSRVNAALPPARSPSTVRSQRPWNLAWSAEAEGALNVPPRLLAVGLLLSRLYHHISSSSPIMTRLYSKGRILGHQRGKHVSHPRTSLIKIDNVDSSKDAQFYCGKVRLPRGRSRGIGGWTLAS